jgi:hypothetical protein
MKLEHTAKILRTAECGWGQSWFPFATGSRLLLYFAVSRLGAHGEHFRRAAFDLLTT